MIKIKRYSKKIEKEYWEIVEAILGDAGKGHIEKICETFLPQTLKEEYGDELCKRFILAPFSELQEIKKYIAEDVELKGELSILTENDDGEKMKGYYGGIFSKAENKIKNNVILLRYSGLTVCPYCNRNYINPRADNVSGAQLDHYYPKAEVPIFSICLYNLIPVCETCNRVKSGRVNAINRNKGDISSPFDQAIEWAEKLFSYKHIGAKFDEVELVLEAGEDSSLAGNIEELKLKEAYKINAIDAQKLLFKHKVYNKTQQKEIKEVLKGQISYPEMKEAIFGAKISEEDMYTQPLAKMLKDLHSELKIYEY